MFLKKASISEEDKELYQLMVDEIDRANSIIGDFLSIGRQRERNNEELNINDILKELMLLIESHATIQWMLCLMEEH